MLSLLSAVHQESWQFLFCKNLESICDWERRKLLCEFRAERKGKQQIKGKGLRSKTEFLHYQQLTLKLISPLTHIFSDFNSFFSFPLG